MWTYRPPDVHSPLGSCRWTRRRPSWAGSGRCWGRRRPCLCPDWAAPPCVSAAAATDMALDQSDERGGVNRRQRSWDTRCLTQQPQTRQETRGSFITPGPRVYTETSRLKRKVTSPHKQSEFRYEHVSFRVKPLLHGHWELFHRVQRTAPSQHRAKAVMSSCGTDVLPELCNSTGRRTGLLPQKKTWPLC